MSILIPYEETKQLCNQLPQEAYKLQVVNTCLSEDNEVDAQFALQNSALDSFLMFLQKHFLIFLVWRRHVTYATLSRDFKWA